jgi:amino acid permease
MDNITPGKGSKGHEEQDLPVPSQKVDLDAGQILERTTLHKGLHARQITMIAIGGAIGTGLIIGTGQGLATAGPASIVLSYAIVGFVVYLVMGALGEMATWIPMASGFTGYATRFCDPSLGFALGWRYVGRSLAFLDRAFANNGNVVTGSNILLSLRINSPLPLLSFSTGSLERRSTLVLSSQFLR